MLHALSNLLAVALCGGIRQSHPQRMEEWFRIEYGKEWRHALAHYRETGSIHWK